MTRASGKMDLTGGAKGIGGKTTIRNSICRLAVGLASLLGRAATRRGRT